MNSIEKWLNKLEAESKALKQGFYQSATKIPLHTRTARATTTPNAYAMERILVTFTTKSRKPTIAQLEIKSNGGAVSRVRRTNYAHGAQWVVYRFSPSPWVPTNYEFVVHSMMDGVLSARNMGE
jgi:hypothetical protein